MLSATPCMPFVLAKATHRPLNRHNLGLLFFTYDTATCIGSPGVSWNVGPKASPVETHQHGNGMLGNRVGRVAWHARNVDSQPARSFQVHLVIACAAHGDEPDAAFRQLLQHLVGQ